MLQKFISSKQKALKKNYVLCFGNFPKHLTINNMKKIQDQKDFFVDFNPIDANNILDIHRCLIKRT